MTGVDDALAILLASGSPELKLEGLSIAFGNGKEHVFQSIHLCAPFQNPCEGLIVRVLM